MTSIDRAPSGATSASVAGNVRVGRYLVTYEYHLEVRPLQGPEALFRLDVLSPVGFENFFVVEEHAGTLLLSHQRLENMWKQWGGTPYLEFGEEPYEGDYDPDFDPQAEHSPHFGKGSGTRSAEQALALAKVMEIGSRHESGLALSLRAVVNVDGHLKLMPLPSKRNTLFCGLRTLWNTASPGRMEIVFEVLNPPLSIN